MIRPLWWILSSMFVLLAAAGCDRSSSVAETEEKTLQVTVWTDRFEVFLEHRFVVAGEPTPFVTHITDLQSLEPRREGAVRFDLRNEAGKSIRHIEAGPARPGIYIPELSFPEPGEWFVTLRIPIEEGEAVVRLPPVTVYASREAALAAPSPEAPDGITLLKEQQWKLRIRTESVGRLRLVARLRVAGVVSARPGSRAAVTPPIAGRLLAPRGGVFPSLGDLVEAGQVLALVQPPFSEFIVKLTEAEAQMIRTKLAVDHAQRSYERIHRLAAQKAKSERELQEAAFALATARAEHEAALAVRSAYENAGAIFVREPGKVEGPGLPVVALRAPIGGRIIRVAAAVGEHVSTAQSVFTILDARRVFIEARIPESELGLIGPSPDATYEMPHAPGNLVPILGEGGGRIVFFGAEVDPESRTVPLVYEVPNPKGRLRVGMALDLYIETARAEQALAVPTSAVVEEDGRPVAFVQVSGETFQKRHLVLGIRDGAFVQVLEGLAEGERVVTQGAYAVRLASVSSAIPAHGHAH